MTGMVQTDLAHPPATKFKDEPAEDPEAPGNNWRYRPRPYPEKGDHHRLLQFLLRQQANIAFRQAAGLMTSVLRYQGAQPPHLQHPRPTTLIQPPKRPGSPHQPPTTLSSGNYTPHPLASGILQHHSYAQSQEQPYYAPQSSYTTASAPSQYPSSGPPEIMATTAQLQRPYPPIYHTPQSSSPASVASQSHEPHGRNIYTQSPQMTSQMYGYPPYSPMNPVQPSQYGPNASPQQHPLTTQSLMMPHQTSTAQLPHHPTQAPTGAIASSPTSTVQQPTPPQRTMLNPPLPATTAAPISTSSVHHQGSNVGASSNAAPGPIPATTPLVVRQDSNGVQWIAFEYSRDRVKMEYTIRCDVESVSVDNLSSDFRSENCVYPRACGGKDNYRGNRLVYETECNTVGWALAELNPALRGKRGLIQRAVDSWRNSNQDPRLRSRRVRRMAKLNRRQGLPAQPPPHMAPSTPVVPGIPAASMATAAPRPGLGPLTMGPPQLHHHHAQPDGGANHEEVSGPSDFSNGIHRPPTSDHPPPGPSPTDIRAAQVFHGFHPYPTAGSIGGGPRGPSIPPLLRDSGIGGLGRPPTVATASRIEEVDEDEDEQNPSTEALFGTPPGGKPRKFILVDDTQRGARVRVKVSLDLVDMDEIPDSYRRMNSVFPRTYFPVQMRSPRTSVVPGDRFIKDHSELDDEDEELPTAGRVMVPVPQVDGEGEIAVPRLSRGRRRKEVLLNDLAYRISWSQSRVFAGRMMFLQRSLDAYRNKMRAAMLAEGQEASAIPQHFETRAGKRRFLERKRRVTPARDATAHILSASRRSAEEVEA